MGKNSAMSAPSYDQQNVTIYWDFGKFTFNIHFPGRHASRTSTDLQFHTLLTETAQISAATRIPIHDIIMNLRGAVRPFGPIKAFRAYWDFSSQSSRAPIQNDLSSLSSSGLTLINCPGDGRKDHAVKIMLGRCLPHYYDSMR